MNRVVGDNDNFKVEQFSDYIRSDLIAVEYDISFWLYVLIEFTLEFGFLGIEDRY